MSKVTQKAIEVLNKGGIVIFPTDTAFGIGCRMDNEESIKRLFEIRKRPLTQSTSVLVDSIPMAQNYLLPIDTEMKRLMEQYWPGALTIVLPCLENKVTGLVRGGGNTLGVRMPKHQITQEIIRGIGVPLLGPSANFHGEATPYTTKDLDPQLVKLVDYVVPGECTIREVSTVIDCSQKPWKVLREGAVIINNE